ncbi:MAG: hypothetical protein IPK08_05930 [Bacteroidetes bacterium]|nr:hypothetical protein [Bacteroidota bacterium]
MLPKRVVGCPALANTEIALSVELKRAFETVTAPLYVSIPSSQLENVGFDEFSKPVIDSEAHLSIPNV